MEENKNLGLASPMGEQEETSSINFQTTLEMVRAVVDYLYGMRNDILALQDASISGIRQAAHQRR